jgi:hypothetical protein
MTIMSSLPAARRPALRLLALGLLALGALTPARAARAQAQEPGVITTRYTSIRYAAGEQALAAWYASFVDDMDASVSALLGADPLTGLIIRITPTPRQFRFTDSSFPINPSAVGGAHLQVGRREIDAAANELHAQTPAEAQQNFRHELTRAIARSVSNNYLPFPVLEGLAQYNELAPERGKSAADALAADPRTQAAGAWVSISEEMLIPTGYSFVAFLLERDGLPAFDRYLASMRTDHEDFLAAAAAAYSKPVSDLESEWRAWLPGFLNGGWQRNVLSAYDLAPGRALYAAGAFAAARDHFAQTARLYTDLGRPELAAAATRERDRAAAAATADGQTAAARQALARGDYAAAARSAAAAESAFAGLGAAPYRAEAHTLAAQAARGAGAQGRLAEARRLLTWPTLDPPAAAAAAQDAGASFAALGDAAGVAAVNALLRDLWEAQRLGAAVALGAAGLTALAALAAFRRGRRARHRAAEEAPSWL